ncbi:MAG TPA: carboxypeptidase-like regulatory domain-containing protein, partial [Candidatus Thermoplasmatota archaeon]|nr:carboxypeptidase-like regulatory domain-containing protein [Candidatus Thermoplasmatota archaeon]
MAKTAVLTLALVLLAVPALAAAEDEAVRSDSEAPDKLPAEKATLIGVITDEAGNPVPKAQLTFVHATQGWSYGNTADDGRYAIDTYLGTGQLTVQREGFTCIEQAVALEANPTTLDLVLKGYPDPTAVLTGRITDANGNPLKGVEVSLSPSYRYYERPMLAEGDAAAKPAILPYPHTSCGYNYAWSYKTDTTDAEGVYKILHYGGAYYLNARVRGFVGVNTELTLNDGETLVKDFTLKTVPKDTVTITGIVKDSETGLPVANARVDWYNLQYGKWYNGAYTDAAGKFTINVLPGYTRVQVSADKGHWYYTEIAATDAGEGVSADVDEKRIALPSP